MDIFYVFKTNIEIALNTAQFHKAVSCDKTGWKYINVSGGKFILDQKVDFIDKESVIVANIISVLRAKGIARNCHFTTN